MEKVDLDTLKLLGDDDLRQLGFPMGPRRRLQRIVKQLQCQSPAEATTAETTADCSVSNDARL